MKRSKRVHTSRRQRDVTCSSSFRHSSGSLSVLSTLPQSRGTTHVETSEYSRAIALNQSQHGLAPTVSKRSFSSYSLPARTQESSGLGPVNNSISSRRESSMRIVPKKLKQQSISTGSKMQTPPADISRAKITTAAFSPSLLTKSMTRTKALSTIDTRSKAIIASQISQMHTHSSNGTLRAPGIPTERQSNRLPLFATTQTSFVSPFHQTGAFATTSTSHRHKQIPTQTMPQRYITQDMKNIFNQFFGKRPHPNRMQIEGAQSITARIRQMLIITGGVALVLGLSYAFISLAILALRVAITLFVIRWIKNKMSERLVLRGELRSALALETWLASVKNDSPLYKAIYYINPINWGQMAIDFFLMESTRYMRHLELYQQVSKKLMANRQMTNIFGNDYVIGELAAPMLYGTDDIFRDEEVMMSDGFVAFPIYSYQPHTIDITSTNGGSKYTVYQDDAYKAAKEKKSMEQAANESFFDTFARNSRELEEELASINVNDDHDYPYKHYKHSSKFIVNSNPERELSQEELKRFIFHSSPRVDERVNLLDYSSLSLRYYSHRFNFNDQKSDVIFNTPEKDYEQVGVVYVLYKKPALEKLIQQSDSGVIINAFDALTQGNGEAYEPLKIIAVADDGQHVLFENDGVTGWTPETGRPKDRFIHPYLNLPASRIKTIFSLFTKQGPAREFQSTATPENEPDVHYASSASSTTTTSSSSSSSYKSPIDEEPRIIEAEIIDEHPDPDHQPRSTGHR